MKKNIIYALLPPIVAVVAALIATSVVIVLAGGSATTFLSTVFSVPNNRVMTNIINQASMLSIAGFAAAIGFRMGLFNIGVEGQYIAASCAAAFFAGSGLVSGPLNIFATLLVAIIVGALWASIAAILKVTRGVSEVISAIMLNYIALTLAGYFVQRFGIRTGYKDVVPELPRSSQPLGVSLFEGGGDVWALASVALAIAVGYWFLLNKTRFGFDLRVTGESATAAVASGIGAKKMILLAMLISGGLAGLVWMPAYFGTVHTFGIPDDFQRGLGFTGLAVALLGRNRSIGILFGAVLFAFLAAQSNDLQRAGIARDVVDITQGVVVIAVVVAYEVVRRRQAKTEQEEVAKQLAPAGGAA